MRLLQLEIHRFRGIRDLTWRVGNSFTCLVGPGDSCKSTILDAIDLVLSPRFNVPFDDTDFFDLDTTQPLEITASIGGMPAEFLTDAKYGLYIRGWNDQTGLHDEPEDSDQKVLSIRLRVDRSLEPKWTVTNDRNEDGTPISASDREKFGVIRLATSVERHLGWTRGSILARLSSPAKDLSLVLAEANRAARNSIDPKNLGTLEEACVRAQGIVKELGVAPKVKFQPGLEVDTAATSSGSLVLYDGQVPLRRAGMGTKRLAALALQHEVSKAGGITLVDELEIGLEPHRIGRLLTVLRSSANQGQVFMTTHSPVVVLELRANDICIVRNDGGAISIQRVPDELQGVIRSSSMALLARNVLVCEGRTERGMARALDEHWTCAGLNSFSYQSVEPVDGEGASAPKRAAALATLGYRVALWVDSDTSLDPDRQSLEANGVTVIQWAGGVCTEQRVFADLPWSGVKECLELAQTVRGAQSVRDSIAARAGMKPDVLPENIQCWSDTPFIREAAGEAAKSGKWFKDANAGYQLGRVVCRHLHSMTGTDLAEKIDNLARWVGLK